MLLIYDPDGQIVEGIKVIRMLGLYNMYEVKNVAFAAMTLGYYGTSDFVLNNTKDYAKLITEGPSLKNKAIEKYLLKKDINVLDTFESPRLKDTEKENALRKVNSNLLSINNSIRILTNRILDENLDDSVDEEKTIELNEELNYSMEKRKILLKAKQKLENKD